MALPSDEIRENRKKGKAAYVLHTWKDCLWELGGGGDVPEALEIAEGGEKEKEGPGEGGEATESSTSPTEGLDTIAPAVDNAPPEASGSTLSPQGKRANSFALSQPPISFYCHTI
jgi:translation initiation factor 2D